MIHRFNKKNENEFESILDLIKKKHDSSFYFTKDNRRQYINDAKTFRQLLRESNYSLVLEDTEYGDYNGIILVWKSINPENNSIRHYTKLIAKDTKAANDLLLALTWDYFGELYVKIEKFHPNANAFQNKGWRFRGGRGKEILLYRPKQIKPRIRKEYEPDDNTSKHNNNSKKSNKR